VVTAFDGDDAGRCRWSRRPTTPGELVLRAPDGAETRLTDLNDAWTARFDLVAPVERRFTTPTAPSSPTTGGRREAARDRAFVVQVHGGPHTNDGFGFRFEFQRLAAAGYAVVSLNPRGSSSFGEAFATAALLRYGTVDADDVMAVVDHAAAHHERARRAGAPDGRLLRRVHDQLAGRAPARALPLGRHAAQHLQLGVVLRHQRHRPLVHRERGGPGALARPRRAVAGEPAAQGRRRRHPDPRAALGEDHRCPIEQASSGSRRCKRLGKAETRFVRFPGESHDLSRSGRPDRRIQRIDLILDWFERHA
jgi:dipeptidyl aminopeptidase/acylaminoacyl peptidase